MIGYASRTGTRRNLDALRAAGWHLLVSASGVHRTEGFRFAIDNGAWTAHAKREPWDLDAFRRCLERFCDVEPRAPYPEFIVAPDIVAGGLSSFARSVTYLLDLERYIRCPILIPVQDGMTPELMRPWLDEWVGIFVGGSTAWKLATLPAWGRLARETDCYLHVGRVNSAKRIRLCADAGAHSFDGTAASRFALALPRLEAARAAVSAQLPLTGPPEGE